MGHWRLHPTAWYLSIKKNPFSHPLFILEMRHIKSENIFKIQRNLTAVFSSNVERTDWSTYTTNIDKLDTTAYVAFGKRLLLLAWIAHQKAREDGRRCCCVRSSRETHRSKIMCTDENVNDSTGTPTSSGSAVRWARFLTCWVSRCCMNCCRCAGVIPSSPSIFNTQVVKSRVCTSD